MKFVVVLMIIILLVAAHYQPSPPETNIPLTYRHDFGTFYVKATVGGIEAPYLIDTGAQYSAITQETFEKNKSQVSYLGQLNGRMANGDVIRVPLYEVSEILIGQNCKLKHVAVAVIPGATRGLIGLSALSKVAPFNFSIDPPALTVSHCI